MGNKSSSTNIERKKQPSNQRNNKSSNKIDDKKDDKKDDDWILQCIVEFVQSPECSIFVDGFIDENCLVFDSNNCQIIDEYVKIHSEYKRMVETLLISKCSKIGLTVKQFTESMQKANKTKIDSTTFQYIAAVDDFNVFRQLMTQRNIELEKEAIRHLSQQTLSNINPIDINNMTEEEQIEWALSDSIAIQQQEEKIMESLSNQTQYNIVPSAPFLSREPSHTPKVSDANSDDQNMIIQDNNDPFEMITNINMSEPKRVSLKPLKLKKDDNIINVSFEGIKHDEALPTLTAESIQNIKIKQSSKYNESILKQKQMILNMRKQIRNKEIKTMKPEGVDISKLNVSKQSNLPPLSKSLVCFMRDGQSSDAVQFNQQ